MREIVAAWWRTTAATLVIGVTAGTLLAVGTDGFRALTSEQARRNAIARAPRGLPDVALEDQSGRPFTLAAYRGRPVAVNFVYTRCRSAPFRLPASNASTGRNAPARARVPGSTS